MTPAMTRQVDHRKKRRANGLCAREGCNVVTGDAYRCEEHAREQADASLRWLEAHRDEVLARRRAKRAEQREALLRRMGERDDGGGDGQAA